MNRCHNQTWQAIAKAGPMNTIRNRVLVATVAFSSACASLGLLGSLGGLVQPPRFTEAEDQPAEIRLVGPSADRPIGGAVVRIWTRVSNPNRVWLPPRHAAHDAAPRRQPRRDR